MENPKFKYVRPAFRYSNNKNRYNIANYKIDLTRTFYKYMTIESFLKSLHPVNNKGQGTIQFSEPPAWKDQFERRFYLADYSALNVDSNTTPRLYACCMTGDKESEAAWQVYSNPSLGDEGLCVKLKINRRALADELTKFVREKYTIYEGWVDYQMNAYELYHLHEKERIIGNGRNAILEDNTVYHEFFDNFDIVKYLNLLLIKRKAFEYENEFRIFLVDNSYQETNQVVKGSTRIYPEIDWSEVIESIDVDEHYPSDKFRQLQVICMNLLGLDMSRIVQMDINKMPGQNIKIER